eukprot:CAMPEP_0117564738 /NCGR_PEP_ID=MMETSP0784-20121206/56196_1 /TAXON_ID=39447 /ORGANISM="" /LENGTH=428 /DNA_ID=CAMNT_0005362487 /DNA_START=50 /DNA_END=1333 /DNA_ORIENTATION=+
MAYLLRRWLGRTLESHRRLRTAEIFEYCDTDRSGRLDIHEIKYALLAVGLYPTADELHQVMGSRDHVDLPGFRAIKSCLEQSADCKRGPRCVPYALRGISLEQLRSLHVAFVESGWLSAQCSAYNDAHPESPFRMQEDLYALDRFVVAPGTNPQNASEDLWSRLYAMSQLRRPSHVCSYAELVNPAGVHVDFFLSHYWGHLFACTIAALTSHAGIVYASLQESRLASPCSLTYWVCLFALNQHRKAEEVGACPESGPFNAALAKASRGAIMVVDDDAETLRRIWCLYELSRIDHFGQPFKLVCEHGILGMDPAQNARSILMERTTRVCSNLAVLRAFDAKANTNADKIAIWWRVIDHWVRNGFNEDHEWVAGKTFEDFVDNNECYHFFWTFDARIGRILAGPLFPVSLENGDLEASLKIRASKVQKKW